MPNAASSGRIRRRSNFTGTPEENKWSETMHEGSALLEFDMQEFLTSGILKEKEFREKLESHDWAKYDNKKVIIKGCGSTPIPTWAYMIVTAYLVPRAEKIMYGEPCSSVPIYRRQSRAA